ncbi:MAG: hypothetical protein MUP21_06380 [Dehalococcoidia bacterium]|nr:hypothetical protein [Dehalococcoidia bacterium]
MPSHDSINTIAARRPELNSPAGRALWSLSLILREIAAGQGANKKKKPPAQAPAKDDLIGSETVVDESMPSPGTVSGSTFSQHRTSGWPTRPCVGGVESAPM